MLLGVGKKPPTPQEKYRERKQREEEEKRVHLPPGLYNHGNTCFMNSVLQGLIATPMLSDIVRFSLPESYLPIASRRSPQLTNGHGWGGQYEHPWEQGMPLGDVFVRLMEKAWKAQDERVRTNLSPKDLLQRLGAKYDQYLDFRQQDAHELLRHLLDAMRMEELDIIKKRQPPPPKAKKKKRRKNGVLDEHTTSLKGSVVNGLGLSESTSSAEVPEEERLTSFVDMVFGGQLASILVCQKCKKVSYTYEDFNDLSLSIKAEDYVKERRRDRLKNFAKRLKIPTVDFSDQPRSSSVPVSPTRRSLDSDGAPEPISDGDRRRSLDVESEVVAENPTAQPENTLVDDGSKTIVEPAPVNEPRNDEVKKASSMPVPDKSPKDDKLTAKDNLGDGLTKLGRRISIGMGFKKGRESRRSRSEKESRTATIEEGGSDVTSTPGEAEYATESPDLAAASRKLAALASSSSPNTPQLGSKPHHKFGFSHRPSPSRTTSSSAVPTHPSSPALHPVTSNQSKRAASPLSRTKSSNLPKQSREEAEYLARLLADVPSSSNPFNILRGQIGGSSPDFANIVASNSTSLWQKLGNVQSVEDCLRMFTAVEVLDDENMVGCRRCWKIAHGQYQPRGRARPGEDDDTLFDADSSSSSSSEESDSATAQRPVTPTSPEVNSGEPNIYTPATNPITSRSPQLSRLDLSENASVKSAPNIMQTPSGSSLHGSETSQTTYAGMMVPSISIAPSAPQSPESSSSNESPNGEAAYVERFNQALSSDSPAPGLPHSPSRDSLQLPSRHARLPAGGISRQASDAISSEDSEAEESDASGQSEVASPGSSPTRNREAPSSASTTTAIAPARPISRSSRIPRSKQVIPRKQYKRYLIAKPPPVLVIHLKRFQQVGKAPVQFFANFKKLDDAVSFPEYLDLTPFLLPRKEDYGLGKKKPTGLGITTVEKKDDKPPERCLYRLYAVVVHIGNMLGGHYIAYTALPETPPVSDDEAANSSEKDQAAQSSASPPPPSRTLSFESTSDAKAKHNHHHQHHERKWAYISDTTVKLTTLSEVLKAKAYICMYERI